VYSGNTRGDGEQTVIQFLSYILNQHTPTYGNRNSFSIEKKSDISRGDIANDSFISTTVHVGTHIDMPYHFYQDGQTIKDFDDSFWLFEKILIIEIVPQCIIIKDELIKKLENVTNKECELLIVKTGICNIRDRDEFWSQNFGFHPTIYNYLIEKYPNLRVLGFDSISVSSFSNRLLGREAHKQFLNPEKPILLLEDMDLRAVNDKDVFEKIIIAPLRIEECDGLPCSVIGIKND